MKQTSNRHDASTLFRKLNGSVPLNLIRALELPAEPGIYVIHDSGGIIYIGRTNNLRRRLTEHYELRDNPLLANAISFPIGQLRFSWLITENLAYQIQQEKLWVRTFGPFSNRIKFKTNKQ